jgi:hypothetical protein
MIFDMGIHKHYGSGGLAINEKLIMIGASDESVEISPHLFIS